MRKRAGVLALSKRTRRPTLKIRFDQQNFQGKQIYPRVHKNTYSFYAVTLPTLKSRPEQASPGAESTS